MSRTIQAGDFNKPYQYELAKRQERKADRNVRTQRQSKQNIWESSLEKD
jgi:endonuclease/exonuclease/phosphatase family metal-dependent hydrolase